MRKVLLGAVAVAVVLAPAAAAGSAAQVQLAVVPLPKAALGAPGRPLPLLRVSGALTNAHAAAEATGNVSPGQLKRLGRISGYRLDYGDPFSGRKGVTEIGSEIARYRSAVSARKGLSFWRRDELRNPFPKKFSPGVTFSQRKVPFSGVPGPHWSYGGTLTIKGLKPLSGVDAEFQQGPYVLEVSVTGSSFAAAARLAPMLARQLSRRLQLARAGRLKAKPVTLPRPLKPGPPAHGPKPADMVLTKADVGRPASIEEQHYTSPKNAGDQNALSAFDLEMSPAGAYDYLEHEVLVANSVNEAKYFVAIAVGQTVAAAGSKARATLVDLTGVGHGARGTLVRRVAGGTATYAAVIALYRGSYLGFLVAQRFKPMSTGDVRKLAQAAAKRFDAGYG